MSQVPNIRVGTGFDAHRLVPGRPLVLGGVNIPHHHGLDGHSDADALLHAVSDALLGATAMGDIGQHFPPGDPAFKDADSRQLLRQVVSLLEQAGWQAINVDVTVIAEKPRLAPHIPAMRENLSKDMGLALEAVSIKATTTEGMGFPGRQEGIAAQAVVLVHQSSV